MLGKDISSLISDIYTGARDPDVWQQAMTSVGDQLDAQFLMIATADRRRRVLPEIQFYHVRHNRFDDAIAEYIAEMHRFDPSIAHVAAHPRGGVFDSVRDIKPDCYDDHPYVKWNLATGGSMFWTTMHQATLGDFSFGISVHRSPGSGPLKSDDACRMALIFSHIQNAITLAARTPMFESSEPCVALNGSGYVIDANDAARKLLERHAAVHLSNGQLSASNGAATVGLNQALRNVLSSTESHRTVALDHNGQRLFCDIRALSHSELPLRSLGAVAIVRLIDPSADQVTRSTDWQILFDLTPAEARLSKALLSNVDLQAAAARLGIKHGTARVQLARLFEKTGMRTQAQLIRLLTRLS